MFNFENLDWLLKPFLLSSKVLFCDFVMFVVFGIATAYFLAFSNTRFKKIAEFFVMLPLIFPPMATGFLLLYFFGKNGTVGSFLDKLGINFIFDFKGLVLAGFISWLPLMVRPVQSVFEKFDKNLIEAAEICAKNRFEIALFVIFPNTMNTILASLIIATARSLGEVGISLIIGGNLIGKTDTISLAIYNAVYDAEPDKALILSVLLIIFSMILFSFVNMLGQKKQIKPF